MNDLISGVIGQFAIGVVSGIISGVIVSGFFYVIAGRDLVKAERRLVNVLSLLAKKLEHQDANIKFDVDGKPVSMNYVLRVEPAEIRMDVADVEFTVRDKDGEIESKV